MQGKPPCCLWSRRSSLSIVRIDIAIRLGYSNPSWSCGGLIPAHGLSSNGTQDFNVATCLSRYWTTSLFTCSSLVPVTTYFPRNGGKIWFPRLKKARRVIFVLRVLFLECGSGETKGYHEIKPRLLSPGVLGRSPVPQELGHPP